MAFDLVPFWVTLKVFMSPASPSPPSPVPPRPRRRWVRRGLLAAGLLLLILVLFHRPLGHWAIRHFGGSALAESGITGEWKISGSLFDGLVVDDLRLTVRHAPARRI